MRILTLNAGSNSLKFDMVDAVDAKDAERGGAWGTSLFSGTCDDIGKESAVFTISNRGRTHTEKTAMADHGRAADVVLDWIASGAGQGSGITDLTDIDRVAHRVVHGADRFPEPVRITEQVRAGIAELEQLAPLHNAAACSVIDACRRRISSHPMFAVFDTVFHRSIPDTAALYALPLDLARKQGIRRYGFHGISHQYMALRFAELTKRPIAELKLITLHLEGGSSAAAIWHGRSIDTSMGFTPLAGLMMGTRCGDLDPGIVTHLMAKENWSAQEVERFLNKECGLLGVSGLSADTRILQKNLSNPKVDLAINMFCYRVRHYIGAYMVALGGADAIVFGGGIGENTAVIRQRVCDGLQWCGAELNHARNAELIDQEGCISAPNRSPDIWVIPTKENLMMARIVSTMA